MKELFEIIDPIEDALKNTPEEEAFRLADSIFPIRANTLRKPPEILQVQTIRFKKDKLLELANSINEDLTESNIFIYAKTVCEDYKTPTFESDDIEEIWFDGEGMTKFLKWCELREKDLFNQ